MRPMCNALIYLCRDVLWSLIAGILHAITAVLHGSSKMFTVLTLS